MGLLSMQPEPFFKIPIYDEWLVHAPLHELNALLTSDDLDKIRSNSIHDDKELTSFRNLLAGSTKHNPTTKKGEIDPRFLVFVTTRGCNIKCVYCHFDGPTAPHNSLEMNKCIKTIAWMVETLERNGHKELPIHFFGGEPLTTFALVQSVIDYANTRCQGTQIIPRFIATTNGVLSERRAEWIGEHLDQIILSLDGPEYTHNKNRPIRSDLGSFAATARTADILCEKNIDLSFRGCITSETVQQMGEMAEWMTHRWHPSSIKFEPLTVNSLTISAGLEPPNPFDFAINWFQARDAVARHGVNISYTPVNPGEPRLTSCLVGNDAVVVNPDGKIQACYLQPKDWEKHGMNLNLGEVSDEQGVKIDHVKVDVVRNMVKRKDRCSKCFCRWSCAGGCHVTHTYQGASSEYDDFCIGTRIISACLILEAMGCRPLVKQLLTDRAALERIALQTTDHLDVGSMRDIEGVKMMDEERNTG